MKLEVSVELTLLVALAALVEETEAMLETLALLEETLETLALLEDATLDTLTLLEETLDALALLEETLESLALLEDATLDTLTALEDATLDTLALLEALAALLETFTPVVVPALTLLDVNGKPPGKPLGKPPGKPEGITNPAELDLVLETWTLETGTLDELLYLLENAELLEDETGLQIP